MSVKKQIIVSLLPLAITLGGWQLSLWLNDVLSCQSVGKEPLPCVLLGINIQPSLSLASWWGMLLWVPGLIVSGLMLGKVLAQSAPKPWGNRRADMGHSTNSQAAKHH
jgi:hypothetical protein